VTNIILLALMQVSALAADEQGFDQAYQQSLKTGRPLVVLIGATWCPACQKMKNSILPRVAGVGGLNKVVFTYVDFDQQEQLASRLSRAKSIPQLIRFDRTASGWKSKCLVGAKSPREVYDFINAGLSDEDNVREVSATNQRKDDSAKTASGETPRSTPAASKPQTDSSPDAARRRDRHVGSLPVDKLGSFPFWLLFLRDISAKTADRGDNPAHQQGQPSESRLESSSIAEAKESGCS
jgi:thiol-disulfide isomerase/thioredoxin